MLSDLYCNAEKKKFDLENANAIKLSYVYNTIHIILRHYIFYFIWIGFFNRKLVFMFDEA